MIAAALRRYLFGAVARSFAQCCILTTALSFSAFCSGEENLIRVPPLRVPATAAIPALRLWNFGGVQYVSVADAASRLGLKGQWAVPTQKYLLSDEVNKVEIQPNSRDVLFNGLHKHLGSPVLLHEGKLYLGKIDLDRAFTPWVRPALLGPIPPRPRIIALDAGHGGTDEGMGKEVGLKEKVFTLDVVLRLKKLAESAGYKVVLTRTGDAVFSPLKALDLPHRAAIANAAGADLFVSVHFNSLYPDRKTSGTEVYVYTPKGQRSDKAWSAGQDDDTKPEPMPVNLYDAWSVLFADALQREIIGELKTSDRGQKTMHAVVLQDLNCPAVLVESVFLSNESEARLASKPEFRNRIAASIFAGIRRYVATLDQLRSPEVSIPGALVPARTPTLPSSK
jgi:N-acetylmuramoyl-L-alanine amidase